MLNAVGKAADLQALRAGELHLWRCPVRQPAQRLEQWRSYLSEEEQQRLDRLAAPLMRRQRLVGWGMRKQLMGDYLGVNPRTLELVVASSGKARIAGAWELVGLDFSTSYSNEWILLGFALGRRIGVDVEQCAAIDCEELVAANFTAREAAAWRALANPAERVSAFYAGWTRKEAYVKALGSGIDRPLDTLEVGHGFLSAPPYAEGSADGTMAGWRIETFPIGPRAVGSFAVEEPVTIVRHGSIDD